MFQGFGSEDIQIADRTKQIKSVEEE